jgi:hypothetical protein
MAGKNLKYEGGKFSPRTPEEMARMEQMAATRAALRGKPKAKHSPPDLQAATKARRRRMFTKLPELWCERLAGARYVATWVVAERLLFQSFREHRSTVRLANSTLAARGVTRKHKVMALKDLERLGLVRVDRCERRSPLVTPLLDSAAED